MGDCPRLLTPGETELCEKNSGLAVKNQTPSYPSNIHLPTRLDRPISGFMAQRFVPGFTSLVGSYWPVGASTRTLAPTIVFWRHVENSFTVIAGPPLRLTEKRKIESRRPER